VTNAALEFFFFQIRADASIKTGSAAPLLIVKRHGNRSIPARPVAIGLLSARVQIFRFFDESIEISLF